MTREERIMQEASIMIQRRGWVQGERHNPHGICLSYAIILSIHKVLGTSHGPELRRFYRSTTDRIMGRPTPFDALMIYNDLPDMDKEGVLHILEP